MIILNKNIIIFFVRTNKIVQKRVFLRYFSYDYKNIILYVRYKNASNILRYIYIHSPGVNITHVRVCCYSVYEYSKTYFTNKKAVICYSIQAS